MNTVSYILPSFRTGKLLPVPRLSKQNSCCGHHASAGRENACRRVTTVPLENLEMHERKGIILPSQFSPPMLISLTTLFTTLSSIFRSRAALQLENLALRHQIGVLQRSVRKRPKLTPGDRLLWVWLSRIWRDWRSALAIVKPETVLGACLTYFATKGGHFLCS
jgi:hypothetical protein